MNLTRLQLFAHISSWLPLVALVWDGLTTGLTENPIQAITQRTGQTALVLLLLSLACTPVNAYFGLRTVLKLKRALGLYAFMYAGLHFLTFVFLDYGGNLGLIWLDIANKIYIFAGAFAFLILLVLAITSIKTLKVKLGKVWKRIHRFVYISGILVILHYVLAVKADIRLPLVYGTILLILLILRLPLSKQHLAPHSLKFVQSIRSTLGGKRCFKNPS